MQYAEVKFWKNFISFQVVVEGSPSVSGDFKGPSVYIIIL